MKIHSNHRGPRAFTMTELLVTVAVVAVLAAILLPSLVHARERARRIGCNSRHKQISTGFRLWANDRSGTYPFEWLSRPTNSLAVGSPFKNQDPSELWKLFQVAENDISSPRILVCPSDRTRSAAQNFNTNGLPDGFALPANRLNATSYFLSLDADEESPQVMLAGDRYLTTDPESSSEKGTKFLFGQQDVSFGSSLEKQVRWISTLHQGGGNAAFMDGSAQQLTTKSLRIAIRNQPIGRTNRIWLPNTDATGRGNP